MQDWFVANAQSYDLNNYTPQLCCGWDKSSINFNRRYIY
jgi:hypothetical protein